VSESLPLPPLGTASSLKTLSFDIEIGMACEGSRSPFDSRLRVSVWGRVGEERVRQMALGLSEQLGMTSCIMTEARVGRSRDKELSTQRHYKDTSRVRALGSTKLISSVFEIRLAFPVPDSCSRTCSRKRKSLSTLYWN
jgi:hypothetical protein